MGKLRLDMDHLQVESFDTEAASAAARGTVRGNVEFNNGADFAANDLEGRHDRFGVVVTGSSCLCTISCNGTCYDTCGGDTCTGACQTCAPTSCGTTCPVVVCDPAPSAFC